ncbi:Zinc finger CCCH domain-containing protein 48 [Linum grandiflorum]
MVFKRNVFERIGVSGHDQKNTGIVCRFWKQGNCTHNPCRFVHGESPSPSPTPYSSHSRSNVYVRGGSQSSSQQSCSNVYVRSKLPPVDIHQRDSSSKHANIVADEKIILTAKDDEKKSPETICGELPGDGSSAVSGLCIASGVSKLYCGSIDGFLQARDSKSGQVLASINVGGKIGCALHTLAGPVGQVHALHSDTIGHVFAAAQDGTIWAWKISTDEQGNIFQDVKTWQCIETFKGHDDAVTSLLCYDAFLLSCSLDKKIKVWGLNEERRLEVIYTHEEAHAALALCGIDGIELCGKDVLLCSWNNESVGIYELPSFIEKGRMYSKGEVRGLGVGSKGMFFTGDASGVVTAWNMAEEVAEDGSSRQKKRRKMEQ